MPSILRFGFINELEPKDISFVPWWMLPGSQIRYY
jgi:hypothetical protein